MHARGEAASGPNPTPPARNRSRYAALAVGSVAAGLLTRSSLVGLPKPVSKYSGDAIWALLVFCLLAFVLARKTTRQLALLAASFAIGIEFLQLYHAPWIDHLRSLWIGRMILGNTFNPPDLLAYAAGILGGIFLDRTLASRPNVDPGSTSGTSRNPVSRSPST